MFANLVAELFKGPKGRRKSGVHDGGIGIHQSKTTRTAINVRKPAAAIIVASVVLLMVLQFRSIYSDPDWIKEREVSNFILAFEGNINNRQKVDGDSKILSQSRVQRLKNILRTHRNVIGSKSNIESRDVPKLVSESFISEMGPFSGVALHKKADSGEVFTHSQLRLQKGLDPVEELMPMKGFHMLGESNLDMPIEKRPIPENLPEITSEHATIFISLAAYRDTFCGDTISSIFREARFPERVFIGAVRQQEAVDNFLCTNELYTTSSCHTTAFCPLDNVRIRFQQTTLAKGPTQGRYVSLLMYQGEQFAMIIDSHTRFSPKWDISMIAEVWSFTESGKRVEEKAGQQDDFSGGRTRGRGGVISHYPPGFSDYNAPFSWSINVLTVMCTAHYLKDVQTKGLIRMDGTNLLIKRQNNPRVPVLPLLQPFTAAGFLFGDAAFVMDVPFDPHLDFLFDGEEILYTVRLWTHGYDSYTPSKALVAHIYGRPKAPRVWSVPNNEWWRHQAASHLRYHYFMETYSLNNPPGNHPAAKPNTLLVDWNSLVGANKSMAASIYGQGTYRQLADYYSWAGIDRNVWTISNKHCAR